MEKIKSNHSVEETANKIEAFLKEKGIALFARVNHEQNAKDVDLTIPPAEVLIFGNPLLGTKIMQIHLESALDLPLRMAVIKADAAYIIYRKPSQSLVDDSIPQALLEKADAVLHSIATYASE